MKNDSIAAIATPIGCSGIGIVRISGPDAFDISRQLFRPWRSSLAKGKTIALDHIKSHYLYYGHVYDPENKGLVDEVMMVGMRAPRSYTREDVVEIQSHSGAVILSKILKLVLNAGARMAEPGEFTKRAFLNGRIDLSQAEAIAEMIGAKTEAALRLAASHLTGNLKDTVVEFIDTITQAQVALEAGLEFGDEDEVTTDIIALSHEIRLRLINPIKLLVRNYDDGHVLRDGIRLDIVGRPNVGKSSLMNCLIQQDKAIVTHLPGTTRDLVEAYLNIEGIPIMLTDTAGLHRSEDPIEIIGIQKTRENIERSDLVLLVIDAAHGFTPDDEMVFEHVARKKALLVVNKIDLATTGWDIFVPPKYMEFKKVEVSAKYGQGMEDLKNAIKTHCLSGVDIEPGRSLVPTYRQNKSLKTAMEALERAAFGLENGQSEELVVEDLVCGKNALGLIIGQSISGDVLDEIFGQFCIGK